MCLYFPTRAKNVVTLNYRAAGDQEVGQAPMQALKTIKPRVGTGPGADAETPTTLRITNILDIRFDMASPSAVSLAVAAASGCVFTAEIDVCGSPSSK